MKNADAVCLANRMLANRNRIKRAFGEQWWEDQSKIWQKRIRERMAMNRCSETEATLSICRDLHEKGFGEAIMMATAALCDMLGVEVDKCP
ncbi:MAG: hypothetical protein ACOWWM_09640 [Desulfobacterales bacterium]